jgi:hypothetical protein
MPETEFSTIGLNSTDGGKVPLDADVETQSSITVGKANPNVMAQMTTLVIQTTFWPCLMSLNACPR